MANFDSGVSRYIIGKATVTVGFPVDFKDRAEVACIHCPFLSSNERLCQLNKRPVAFPKTAVGDWCPLEPVEDENN